MAQAYDLLVGLALLREGNAKKLTDWQGILVSVGAFNVLIDRPAVDEMLTVTDASRVLDDRKWLSGLMNYGGRLLPLIELKTLLDPKTLPGKLEDRQVIILVEKYGPIGLLVDSVKGINHFWSDDADIHIQASKYPDLMQMHIHSDNTDIQVLDLKKLMSSINMNMVVD